MRQRVACSAVRPGGVCFFHYTGGRGGVRPGRKVQKGGSVSAAKSAVACALAVALS